MHNQKSFTLLFLLLLLGIGTTQAMDQSDRTIRPRSKDTPLSDEPSSQKFCIQRPLMTPHEDATNYMQQLARNIIQENAEKKLYEACALFHQNPYHHFDTLDSIKNFITPTMHSKKLQTPLHELMSHSPQYYDCEIINGYKETITLLAIKGASLTSKNNEHKTPLQLAQKNHPLSIQNFLENLINPHPEPNPISATLHTDAQCNNHEAFIHFLNSKKISPEKKTMLLKMFYQY